MSSCRLQQLFVPADARLFPARIQRGDPPFSASRSLTRRQSRQPEPTGYRADPTCRRKARSLRFDPVESQVARGLRASDSKPDPEARIAVPVHAAIAVLPTTGHAPMRHSFTI